MCVSWEDAQAYVVWLNNQTSGGYRLLTESEWEYAARAGGTSHYPWGDTGTELCAYMNGADETAMPIYAHARITCTDNAIHTAPVGSYLPNLFGLYDMIGNAREWVEDCYERSLEHIPIDGSAYTPGDTCARRAFRGGSWFDSYAGISPAARSWDTPDHRETNVGFRVARTL